MLALKTPPTRVVRAVEVARHFLDRIDRRMAPPEAVLLDMILGGWVAQAITAAADLGIADALASGPLSARDLADEVDADVDGLSRLMRALISRGIFGQRRDGRYELTSLAEPLRRGAEVSLAAEARFAGSRQHREHWSHLTDAIRTGRAVVPVLRGKSMFDYLADEPELADIFNQAMTSVSEMAIAPLIAAYDFGPFPTVVDVGGGHGRLLSAILNEHPASDGVLYDLPQVVADAPELLREQGVHDRVRIEPGSFFDTVPPGGDAYVLKNVIHDWPDDDAVRILRNVRDAAGPGKTVLLLEFVIPPHGREFIGKWLDLEMLVVASSRERTVAEYRQLLDRAGFSTSRVIETVSPFSVIEAVAV